ncbi:DUF1758 domain-containing protein [Trichonephila clavipes]|nr:DUF1758 domain-containing protein [Trichonephila clavipes]
MDDNCRPHHANLVEDFLFEEGIVRMEWPACSPDMNPIEHVFDALGRRFADRQPPHKLSKNWKEFFWMKIGQLPITTVGGITEGRKRRTELFSGDFEEAETYRDRYLEKCFKIENRLQENSASSEAEKRKFKLPKIELKKFNGDPKEFLAFWSPFKKIHNDSSIAEEDKMQFLLQSVEPPSKAERLVLSFPATAANYSKAIEQLKERFGRDDLLVQIDVRDLLGLVMKNAVKGRSKTDLTYLYDELEGKLRALESLGRTQEKYGDFLVPLVESCLPEETLLAWERSRYYESTQKTRSLEHLMNFLRKEVLGDEMMQLARTGFGPQHNFRKNNAPVECVRQSELASALGVKKRVRALIDSASQSSYVSERLVNQSVVQPLRTETVRHAIFGGNQTDPKPHRLFSVEDSELRGMYTCNFEVLSERNICGLVPKISDQNILKELRGKNIDLTDSSREGVEIDLLIGADVTGRLLTGNVITLHSGLTAVESKLGWTVFGKKKFCGKDKFTTTLSMHVGNIPLQNLWELEVLGITDPTETVKEREDLSDFREIMRILPGDMK